MEIKEEPEFPSFPTPLYSFAAEEREGEEGDEREEGREHEEKDESFFEMMEIDHAHDQSSFVRMKSRMHPSHSANRLSLPSSPCAAGLQMPAKKLKQACKRGIKRGSYNCGKCGQPKKGHVCVDTPDKPSPPPGSHWNTFLAEVIHSPSSDQAEMEYEDDGMAPNLAVLVDLSPDLADPCTPLESVNTTINNNKKKSLHGITKISGEAIFPSKSLHERYKCAMAAASLTADQMPFHQRNDITIGMKIDEAAPPSLPSACLVHILSRLPPQDLLAASFVSTQWRECATDVWAAVWEARLSMSKLPPQSEENIEEQYVGHILSKCPNLKQLVLNVSSVIDNFHLQQIAYSKPHLTSLEISLRPGALNNVTGDGLKALLDGCPHLWCLKLDGCHEIAEIELRSNSLTTLWLAGCDSLHSASFECPAMRELSLDLVTQEGYLLDNDDRSGHYFLGNLTSLLESIRRDLRGLRKLHIASRWLSDQIVCTLFASEFRFLRMLSLTFGADITDKSVGAITSSCHSLELIDLSGSSITDRGLEQLCKSYARSLSKVLIAMCTQISQVGVEMVSQLPLLCLLDCGRVIANSEESKDALNVTEIVSLSLQSSRIEKLSLWGCSKLQVLMLDCPKLSEVNLVGCSALKPDKIHLICPSLKKVHVGKDEKWLLQAIQSQLENNMLFSGLVLQQSCGTKRVLAPCTTGQDSNQSTF